MICILSKALILPDIMMTETLLNNIKCKWVNLYSQFFLYLNFGQVTFNEVFGEIKDP